MAKSPPPSKTFRNIAPYMLLRLFYEIKSVPTVALPEVTSVDITSEMAVLCSSLQPVRTSELEMGGDSGSPSTPVRRNTAASAVRVPKLPPKQYIAGLGIWLFVQLYGGFQWYIIQDRC